MIIFTNIIMNRTVILTLIILVIILMMMHLLKTMRRQVFPQAPSPTITNFFRTLAVTAILRKLVSV